MLPLHEAMERWAAGSPRLYYVDRFQTFESSQMQNVDHVTHDGAAVYTKRLTRVLRSMR